MLHVYSALAEKERTMSAARTTAALAAKKAQGVTLGNRTNLTEAGDTTGYANEWTVRSLSQLTRRSAWPEMAKPGDGQTRASKQRRWFRKPPLYSKTHPGWLLGRVTATAPWPMRRHR